MREILFRGKTIENEEWVEGYFCHVPCGRFQCEEHLIQTIKEDGRIGQLHTVYERTVGQFTGLYDSTKWEGLTDAEKLDFYHQHYIGEDGMSVRFQHIDDVKFLWKGKKIFEGDIVKMSFEGTDRAYNDEIFGSFDETDFDGHKIGVITLSGHGTFLKASYGELYVDGEKVDWKPARRSRLAAYRSEVIGNIHDNPEMLKGGDS